MNITEIDPNLKLPSSLEENDIVWADAAAEPFRRFGTAGETDTPFSRIPASVVRAISPRMEELNRHTAGIRLRFATDSPYIAVKMEWDTYGYMGHMAESGSSGIDLYRVRDGVQRFVGAVFPPFDFAAAAHGIEGIIYVPGGMTEYVMGLPLYNDVKRMYIGIKEGCHLTAGTEEYHNKKPVVFYGSSITQGACACRPGNCYQGYLSRWLNMDYLNLGFAGNARGEQVIADFIAGLDMAAFVCDYDYNAVDLKELRQTHYNLYETVRRAHPDLPVVLISRPDLGDRDCAERLGIIIDTYRRAVDAGDRNIYLINGGDFFPGNVADTCTVDGCHPTDLGFYFMALGIEPILRRVL